MITIIGMMRLKYVKRDVLIVDCTTLRDQQYTLKKRYVNVTKSSFNRLEQWVAANAFGAGGIRGEEMTFVIERPNRTPDRKGEYTSQWTGAIDDIPF